MDGWVITFIRYSGTISYSRTVRARARADAPSLKGLRDKTENIVARPQSRGSRRGNAHCAARRRGLGVQHEGKQADTVQPPRKTRGFDRPELSEPSLHD
jgi:hypothetical protein